MDLPWYIWLILIIVGIVVNIIDDIYFYFG